MLDIQAQARELWAAGVLRREIKLSRNQWLWNCYRAGVLGHRLRHSRHSGALGRRQGVQTFQRRICHYRP